MFDRLKQPSGRKPAREQSRPLRFEQLGARVMLQGNVYWDGTSSNWTSTTPSHWYTSPTNFTSQYQTTWQTGDIACFQAGSNVTITVSGQVSPGTINFGGNGATSATFVVTGGEISLTGTVGIFVAPLSSGADPPQIDSALVGSGQLVTKSDGTLILTSANNSYSGGTDIQAGTLQLENGATLGAEAATLQLDTLGTLDLNGSSITVGGLTGSGTITDTSSNIGVNQLTADLPAGVTDVFGGSIKDAYNFGSSSNASLRLLKTGGGELDLGGANCGSDFSGGVELDAGTIALESNNALGGLGDYNPPSALVVNAGTLDLNGQLLVVSSLNGSGGTITDNSNDGNVGGFTVLQIQTYDNGTQGTATAPSVFGGTIEDGPSARIVLYLNGDLTLTGQNTYAGGTRVDSGWLQIGDGVTDGWITGAIDLHSQNSLIFNVAADTQEAFDGIIYWGGDNGTTGSVLKTGLGTLTMTYDQNFSSNDNNDAGVVPDNGNGYPGATTVEYGTLFLGMPILEASSPDTVPDALPTTTNLIIDNGAIVNLGGQFVSVETVTLNDGTIQSTDSADPGGSNVSGELDASNSFNVANGTISSSVILGGHVSLNKRTAGAVTINGREEFYGGTFVDQGTLTYNRVVDQDPTITFVNTYSGAARYFVGSTQTYSSDVHVLYWNPPNNNNFTQTNPPTWDNVNSYWSRSAPVYPINTTENTSWPSQDENYVAVFEAPGDKTQELVDGGLLDIAVTVHPCAIYFASQGFDVEDNGTLDPNYEYLESEITPYYDPNNTGVCPQSMVIDVAANCSDTLGAVIADTPLIWSDNSDQHPFTQYPFTIFSVVSGGITVEGAGILQLNGDDGGGGNTYGVPNESSYSGGTFIDSGTVDLGGTYGLGGFGLNPDYPDDPNPAGYGPTDMPFDVGALVMAGSATLNLNGWSTTITSLNSSYSSSGTEPTITDNSSPGNDTAKKSPSDDTDIARSLPSRATATPACLPARFKMRVFRQPLSRPCPSSWTGVDRACCKLSRATKAIMAGPTSAGHCKLATGSARAAMDRFPARSAWDQRAPRLCYRDRLLMPRSSST